MDLMSTLKNVAGQILGGNADAAGMISAAQRLIDSQGGLNGLVQSFEQKGLTQIVGSWVSQGANLPISADQLKGVFGDKIVSEIAQKTGKTPDELLGGLSSVLPSLVDHLTPNGKIN